MKSTNYQNTFISVAESCKRDSGTIPPAKTPPTVARITYDIMSQNPYGYTSDEVLFKVEQQRHPGLAYNDFAQKPKACFRCSPLSKNYGWGFHFDESGKVAIYGMETLEYQQLLDNGEIEQKHAFSVNQ